MISGKTEKFSEQGTFQGRRRGGSRTYTRGSPCRGQEGVLFEKGHPQSHCPVQGREREEGQRKCRLRGVFVESVYSRPA